MTRSGHDAAGGAAPEVTEQVREVADPSDGLMANLNQVVGGSPTSCGWR